MYVGTNTKIMDFYYFCIKIQRHNVISQFLKRVAMSFSAKFLVKMLKTPIQMQQENTHPLSSFLSGLATPRPSEGNF